MMFKYFLIFIAFMFVSCDEEHNVYNTVPNAPTELSGDVLGQHSVRLRWIDNSDNEDVFYADIREDSSDYVSYSAIPLNSTEYIENSLQSNTIYRIKLLAHNEIGFSEPSNEIIIITF